MAILLAGLAALLYGTSDYVGGRASRRLSPLVLIAIADAIGLVVISLIVWRLGDPRPPTGSLLWGSAAGLCGLLGVLSLYRALSAGVMTVAAPITGVVGVSIPVVVGFALGDRPGVVAIFGIALAIAAVAFVSGAIGVPHQPTPRRVVAFAVLAGTGFGLLFVFYQRAGLSGGWWPLVAARSTTVPVIWTLLATMFIAERRRAAAVAAPIGSSVDSRVEPAADSMDGASSPPEPSAFEIGLGGESIQTAVRPAEPTPSILRLDRAGALSAVAIAFLAGGANAAYLASTRYGLLSIVAVVVTLFPAVTVTLAMVLDAERVRRPQSIGLVLAGLAVVLVTIGA